MTSSLQKSRTLPRIGALEATGNPFEPYRLVDAGGVTVVQVILIEGTYVIGGVSRLSIGVVMGTGTRYQKAAGIDGSADEVFALHMSANLGLRRATSMTCCSRSAIPGLSAELIAQRQGISQAEWEAFSVRSHETGRDGDADGRFAGEIIALSAHRLDRQTGEVVPDEGNRRAGRGDPAWQQQAWTNHWTVEPVCRAGTRDVRTQVRLRLGKRIADRPRGSRWACLPDINNDASVLADP